MSNSKIRLGFKELFHQQIFVRASGLALVLVFVASGLAVNAHQKSTERQNIIASNLEIPAELNDILPIDQIRTLASNDVPAGATINKIELENEHGTILYKVMFSDGSYRLYDAKTGNAFNNAVTEQSNVPANFVATTTLQQARNIASAQRPGKTITKIEIENEEGKVVYSVRFSDGGRVDVNATNGAVLRVRQADNTDDSNSSGDSSSDSSDTESDDSGDDSSQSGSDDSRGDDNSGSDRGSESDDQ